MTEVLNGAADTAGVGRPRRDRDEPRLIDDELADQLIEQARRQGVELLGDSGLLKQMTKGLYLGCRELGRTDTKGQGGRTGFNGLVSVPV